MKINANNYFSLLTALVLLLWAGCTSSKKEESVSDVQEDTTEMKENTETAYNVDAKFKKQLGDLVTAYVDLKDAFIASDAAKVKAAIPNVKTALGKTDMELLSGEAHVKWMEYLNGMDEALIEMQGVDDIEAQRGSFSTLSNNLYESLKAFGTGGETVYYDFCPMAFDNKGAFWLSTTEPIRNPYFGDKMLTCGSIEDTIK